MKVVNKIPASFHQEKIWFIDEFESDYLYKSSPVYHNIPIIIKLQGIIDKNILEESIRLIIKKHSVLSTKLDSQDGNLYQSQHETLVFTLITTNIQDDLNETNAKDIDLIINEEIERPFIIDNDLLIRGKFIKINNDEQFLIITIHHVLCDRFSVGLILNELFDNYKRILNGEILYDIGMTLQYSDYTLWEREQQKELEDHLMSYWRLKLKGKIQALNLPIDRRREDIQIYKSAIQKFILTDEISNRITAYSNGNNFNEFIFLLGAFKVLLYKYSNQEDIIVGTIFSNREQDQLKSMVGPLSNLLPLRSNINNKNEFRSFEKDLKKTFDEAKKYSMPFERLVLKLNLEKDMSRTALFDVLFHYEPCSFILPDIKGVKIDINEMNLGLGKYDLNLLIQKNDGIFHGVLVYNVEYYNENTIKSFISHFQKLINNILIHSQIKICDLEILNDDEKHKLLYEFNKTEVPYSFKTIHKLFEEQVERSPDAIALVIKEQKMTYSELNSKSEQLAYYLKNKGVKKGCIIGLLAERSFELIIGMFGILKTGSAYLPILPSYPEERINYILQDSNSKILLTYTEKKIKYLETIDVVFLKNNIIFSQENKAKFDHEYDPENIAYIIYTSGSTGKPKGVLIEHHSVANRLLWMQKKYPINQKDIILQKTPIVFDVSVWELFWWSFQGARLCLLNPEKEKDPEEMVREIEKNNVTTMHFVPSMLSAFMEYLSNGNESNRISSMRQVFSSGEALQTSQVNKFNKLLYSKYGVELINLYGPTEATVDVTYYNCASTVEVKKIPIGKPIDNTRMYITNKDGNLNPIGIRGELCISGVCLARGYINQVPATNKKFISNPFENDEILYKTGDLARWMPDGNIEYLGRLDDQVKIRGYRIELGEIEYNLLKYEGIKNAIIVYKENKYLCAYYVSKIEIEQSLLRKHLENSLPDYMMPSYFVHITKVPLTFNGKINKNALPEPEIKKELQYLAPKNKIEKYLVNVWANLLNIKENVISINSDFFSLGGHSLNMVILIASIYKHYNIKVPLSVFFNYPTIKGLAEYLNNAKRGKYLAIPLAEKKEYYELSSAQKRLFFLQNINAESTFYNIFYYYIINSSIDKKKFEKTLLEIINRHEILRTSFELRDNMPVQIVHSQANVDINYYKSTKEGVKDILKSFVHHFNLAVVPLFKIGLIEINTNEYIIITDIHHIINDDFSNNIFNQEFKKIYSGDKIDKLDLQYKDFSEWQNKQKRDGFIESQENYWLKIFEGQLPVLNLPIDYLRTEIPDFDGDNIYFEIDSLLSSKLDILAKEEGVTMYMLFLALINVFLSKLSGQEDIIVGTAIANRDHDDLNNMIGMFANTLALRNKLDKEKTFLEFLLSIKETSLKAFENQNYQFEDLIDKLRIKRTINRNPLFDVLYGFKEGEKDNSKLYTNLDHYTYDLVVTKFDLCFFVVNNKNIKCAFEYKTRLFKKETIEKFITYFKEIINTIIKNPEIKIKDIELFSKNEISIYLSGMDKEKRLFQTEFNFD